jgi:hypothetical protein
MLLDRSPYKFLNVDRPAFTGIERPEALVNLSPQLAKLLNVRQQTAANLLLIGGRQARHFGDRLFEKFDHGKPYYPIGTGIKVQNWADDLRNARPGRHMGPNGVRAAMVQAAG